ncbi:hypothetical protein [Enterobacter ludwigii]|uniref:hypothetical protein n=1 Tax=Enterobacter ludwigii TaxID=299767 RepID=UPI0006429ECF|nr:hypothetical protein [Enterobacter ludwigii]KLP36189.1 hypothetical protein ABR36_16610 [Enterobacter ludwigii]
MSTITRVQAQKIIEAADAVITALAGTNEDVHPESDNMLRLWDDLNDRYAPPEVVRELARIALASLEAEPVGFRSKLQPPSAIGSEQWDYTDHRQPDAFELENCSIECLYTAPPAPVSVPTFEEWCKRTEQKPVGWVRDAMKEAYDACRAAMLHGADGNSPVIPDGWVLVPVELTCEMDEAAWNVCHGTRTMSDIWSALLAAAPQQEGAGGR